MFLFIYPFEKIYIPAGAALIISLLFFGWRTEMIPFIARQINMASSNEIEKRYVRTRPEEYIFPEKKRNLIIIHLESIENLYQKPEIFGCNLIPELSKLQRNNVSFYGNVQVTGSAWTQAFLTCLQYGLFRCFVPSAHDEGTRYNCLDSAYSLNEIFSKNDYTVSFITGAFLTFGGYDSTFRYVKSPRIIDRKVIEQNPDYWKFIKKNISRQPWSDWGVPDKFLYGIAKQELQTISKMKKPFFFMMSLLDTHNPGYIYPDTPRYHHNIADAILETDMLVSQFVKWIQKQDFYSNTTIVLLSDHLAGNMLIRNKIFRELKERENIFSLPNLKERRTAYNCFINLPFDLKEKQINRLFTSIDLAPSMLASVGVKNPNLGFGISLFSNQKNFAESYGKNVIDKMYQTQFLYKKNDEKKKSG